jgi:mono/diheme cytochrome c family protein
MRRHRIIAAIVLFAALVTLPVILTRSFAQGADETATASDTVFLKTITPLLQQNCYQCHGNGKQKGGVELDSYKTAADVDADREQWEDVLKEIQSGEMPPPAAKNHPSLSDRNIIANWILGEIYKVDPAHPDPGRVTIRRLNRDEYNNTIRDLVGVDFQPAADFPSDDSGYGFDNNGDVLSLSPVLMDKYLAAATRIMDEAIVTEKIPSQLRHYNANLMEMGFNADGDRGDGWMPLGGLEEDGVSETIPVPAGDYIVRVYTWTRPHALPPPGPDFFAGRGRRGHGGRSGAGRNGPTLQNAPTTGPVITANGDAPPSLKGRGAALAVNDPDLNDVVVNDNNVDTPPLRMPGKSVPIVSANLNSPTTQPGAQSGQNGRPATQPSDANLPPMKLSLMVDGVVIQDQVDTGTEAKPVILQYRVGVSQGKHRFAITNRRIRGGKDELTMVNGRIGQQQGGTIWVKWVEIEGPLPGATIRFPVNTLNVLGEGRPMSDGTRQLGKDGQVTASFTTPTDGEYVLRAQAYADQAGKEPTCMEWLINGKVVKKFDVLAPGHLVPIEGQHVFSLELLHPMPYVYETKVKLPAGPQQFSVAFINDFSDPNAANPNLRQRNLYIKYLEVENPAGTQPLPPMPAALAANFTVKPTPETKSAAAREILGNFAQRAWRRPVEADELHHLMKLFNRAEQDGESFEAALKLPMKAVLVSPYFLFRGEVQPDPNDPKSIHSVSEIDLASRLSYFLWSSMPDDELLNLAEHGQLRQNLAPQVRRMLASPKAQALVDDFSGQWLQTRNLDLVAPDQMEFPDYDANLREAMRTETQMFFGSVMREDRSVIDFLTGDYTFVNQRLAEFYGIKGITGDQFHRVSLEGTHRRGILTQASVLTITSNPTRTSPVKRGKWVLENLLNTPPPPPPPDVPLLANDGHPDSGTLRQQMEQHRANPACASCHAQMDPLGFGLENFDGIGKWRDKDGDDAVDPSGQLATGEKFAGAVELEDILASSRRDQFLDCITEKMLTYALGRGVEPYDRPAVQKIIAGMENNDLKFSSLINGVVNSVPFQMERGESAVTDAQ